MAVKADATIDDLYEVPGKAEIVNGVIVHMPPTGPGPGYAADEIYVSLRSYAKQSGRGVAFADNKGYRVELPNRSAFSPDASYYTGAFTGMSFMEGAPDFAVEVRSEGDYGPGAEVATAQKRQDYFAAGTLVVWDVDLLSDDTIRSYQRDNPESPRVFARGQAADAEPAVPGWTFPVDSLFY